MSASRASHTSRRLCGGMLVAMPTAMPADPLMRRFGILLGRTSGSFVDSSKFGTSRTVSVDVREQLFGSSVSRHSVTGRRCRSPRPTEVALPSSRVA